MKINGPCSLSHHFFIESGKDGYPSASLHDFRKPAHLFTHLLYPRSKNLILQLVLSASNSFVPNIIIILNILWMTFSTLLMYFCFIALGAYPYFCT